MIDNILIFLSNYPWIFLIPWFISVLVINNRYADIIVGGTAVTDPDGVSETHDELTNQSLHRKRLTYKFIATVIFSLIAVFCILA